MKKGLGRIEKNPKQKLAKLSVSDFFDTFSLG